VGADKIEWYSVVKVIKFEDEHLTVELVMKKIFFGSSGFKMIVKLKIKI